MELYTDDGVTHNLDKLKKTFQKMFKNKGPDIITKYSLKIVN